MTITGGATTANEGDTNTYTYTVTDPGDDTITVVESCGTNGNRTDTAAPNSFDCTFPDGPASSTVLVTANDADGARRQLRQPPVTIANVKPTVTITGGATTANEGDTNTYTYTVSDPGDDTITVVESCGTNGDRTDTAAPNSFDCTFPDGPASSTVLVTANDEDPGAGNTDSARSRSPTSSRR